MTRRTLSPRVWIAGSLTAILILCAAWLGTSEAWAYSRPAGADQSAPSATAAAANWGTSTLIRELPKGIAPPDAPAGTSLIRLGAGYTLDPASDYPERNVPPALRALPPAGNERGYFLVQFRGPVTDRDRAAVEDLGRDDRQLRPGLRVPGLAAGDRRGTDLAASARVVLGRPLPACVQDQHDAADAGVRPALAGHPALPRRIGRGGGRCRALRRAGRSRRRPTTASTRCSR